MLRVRPTTRRARHAGPLNDAAPVLGKVPARRHTRRHAALFWAGIAVYVAGCVAAAWAGGWWLIGAGIITVDLAVLVFVVGSSWDDPTELDLLGQAIERAHREQLRQVSRGDRERYAELLRSWGLK